MAPLHRLVYLAVAGFIIVSFIFGYHFTGSNSFSGAFSSEQAERRFHLLLPATGPNADFCRLLLTAGILGYPEPVLIGWNGRGVYNGTESHLFKITETLTYLRSLPASADGDLVLILDAYDITLQLRPEVMISRYFDILKKNDARLVDGGILGKVHGGNEVRHSVVFGPDKIFWPQGPGDPSTWAVPESTLPKNAFGPQTDTNMFTVRPRWLNSGTIMGPAKDMRDLFAATLDMLSRKYDAGWNSHGSDQYYFAEVWAEQEVKRMELTPGRLEDAVPKNLPEDTELVVPEIPDGKRTEYGICLDYEMDLFQTAAAFEHHWVWMKFNTSSPATGDSASRIDQWKLDEDVANSEGPFTASPEEFPEQLGWEDVSLGTNSISKKPFALFHVTGEKTVRDRFWPRNWFHPHGEALLKASKRKTAKSKDPDLVTTVGGVKWRQGRPDGRPKPKELPVDEKGGAWRDNGEYISWTEMCSSFEDQLYSTESKEQL